MSNNADSVVQQLGATCLNDTSTHSDEGRRLTTSWKGTSDRGVGQMSSADVVGEVGRRIFAVLNWQHRETYYKI